MREWYKRVPEATGPTGLPQAAAGNFVGLDITDPEIDFVALAKSLGVGARRIGEPDALSDAVSAALKSTEPRLIEVTIARQTADRLEYG